MTCFYSLRNLMQQRCMRSQLCTGWCIFIVCVTLVTGVHSGSAALGKDALELSVFDVDASPPIGSPLAYDPTREITQPLSLRGIVIRGAGKPIVLCAVDWLGIGNEANTVFRQRLAAAAGTTPDRVAVHTLHQHDAPRCDFSSAKQLDEVGKAKLHYDMPFQEQVLENAAQAVKNSLGNAKSIDSVAYGAAEVKQVASNRRMLDSEGKVVTTRYTACRDEAVRALPEGVIDPLLRILTFYSGETAVARLSFYATHPQSYYRTGGANPDFPGMARDHLQDQSGIFQVHFNGAGGNLGAGKYNDGSHPVRQILADRVEDGMVRAVANEQRQPLDVNDVQWTSEAVQLPLANHLRAADLAKQVTDPSTPETARVHASDMLAYVRRVEAKQPIVIGCLQLGDNSILFMPGELFVEYQLAAAHIRPDRHVAMAAYGDYGPFYIGTRVAYPQGGYETSVGASNVSPEAEAVLLTAMKKLLHAEGSQVHASDFTDTMGPGLPATSKSE